MVYWLWGTPESRGSQRSRMTKSSKIYFGTVIVAAVLTAAYIMALQTERPRGFEMRTWFYAVRFIGWLGWPALFAAGAVLFGKRALHTVPDKKRRTVIKTAVALLVVICTVMFLFALLMIPFHCPETEYGNQDGTVTVCRSNWPSAGTKETWSLWKKEGLFYRSFIREQPELYLMGPNSR